VFVDVLKKIHQSAYVSMKSMLQEARKSQCQRDKTESVVSAYIDYVTMLLLLRYRFHSTLNFIFISAFSYSFSMRFHTFLLQTLQAGIHLQRKIQLPQR